MSQFAHQSPNAIISIRSACELLGVSRTTLWRMVNVGQFPAPLDLSPNRRGFLKVEVDAWIERRAADRSRLT